MASGCQSLYHQRERKANRFLIDIPPKICNELPEDVQSATSIASFRKKLKA